MRSRATSGKRKVVTTRCDSAFELDATGIVGSKSHVTLLHSASLVV